MDNNAKINQDFYNSLKDSDKLKYINQIFHYYDKKIPLIQYSLKSILWNFNNLKKSQNFLIKNNNIFDTDHEKHIVEINGLHNFYNNKFLIKNQKNNYKINYEKIIDNYLKNIYENYLQKTKIPLINKSTFSVNPLSFQHSFITPINHSSYHFKYIVEMIYIDDPLQIIDIDPLYGNNLLASLSISNKVGKYVTMEKDTMLRSSYVQMINDLSVTPDKYIICNNDTYYLDIVNNTDLVFYHINMETKYDHMYNILYLPIFTLKKDGYLIICTEKDDNDFIIKEMKYNSKISYEKTIIMHTNVEISYIIFRKNTLPLEYKVLDTNVKKVNIDKIDDNPPLNIIDIEYNDRKFHVIQDNILMCGTKQRAVRDMLKKVLPDNVDNFTYASSHNGYGTVATAYGATAYGKMAYVFLSGVQINDKEDVDRALQMRQIKTLMKLNAKIFLCQNYDIARTLKYEISTITKGKDWIKRENFFMPEMGFHDYKGKVFSTILGKKIREAAITTKLSNTSNVWLVAGSGGIAESIVNAFPKIHLYIYLTGYSTFYYNVVKWAKLQKNVTILNDNKDYVLDNTINDYYDYYESVEGYDSKIWPYVKQFGKNDDYIWNVNSD